MKAVIMAGGEGTRLRPLTLDRPKPMIPLFGKPVMEHIIGLLKRHGFTDICVTLQYMPQVVTEWFGDGAELGVKLTYFVEKEPLGTAGSVKNCMAHLGGEDFLVISGDAVCDLDLSAALGFHRTSRAAATLILHRHSAPLEYGLVLTRDDGRIQRFIEKPGWGQVFTDTVNTGIYLLTRRAMDLVPGDQPYDFGKDLFPLLLSRGAPLYGHVADGYWCDMGDCAAYLDCAADALSGRVKLDLALPQSAPGVWAAQPIPAGVSVVPPCWIGPGAELGEGSLIGPHAILEEGARVGRRSLVQRSILMAGAAVGDRCTLYGAILCRSSTAKNGAVLNEGAVLGAESAAGEGSVLLERVKVWPGRESAAGARLTASLIHGGSRGGLFFGDGGVVRGELGEELSPEALMALGSALGAEGKVGLGWAGGEAARLLARSAGCGAAAAGAEVLVHDGGCPSAGAWLAGRYALPVSLFVEQAGERTFLHFFDRRGLPLSRSRERKLEGAVLRGEVRRVPAGRVGPWRNVSGVSAAYAAEAAKVSRLDRQPITPVAVSVPGETPADRVLASALEELGCVVLRKRAPGVPGFAAEYGGLRLTAWDEEGRTVDSGALLTLVSLIELDRGGGRVAVPAGAPAAVEALAEGRPEAVLRLDRDGPEAEELYAALPWLRDGVFAACRICARLGQTGERLRTLVGRVPRFVRLQREVPLQRGRGEVMQSLAETGGDARGEGVRIRSAEAWIWMAPLSRRSALRVVAEAADMETAAELCDFYVKRAQELDRQGTDGQRPQ